MRVLVGCEFSGVVRRAFRALGHEAYSCDKLPADDDSEFHIQGDVLEYLDRGWDLGIFHPPCTRLANSGVRWLHNPPRGKTKEQMWRDLETGAKFYVTLRDAPIPMKAIENPVMNPYAKKLVRVGHRQVVQPWWFGDPAFKATGLELINLPELAPTKKLTPPKKGTDEHKAWSVIHRASPGPDRWKMRSRTFDGIGEAMADQWGRL